MATEVPVMLTHNPMLVADTILGVVQITQQELFTTLLYLGALLGFMGMIFGYLSGSKTSTPKSFFLAVVVLLTSIKLTSPLAVVDPLSGRTRVIDDVPAVIVALAWSTSSIGAGFQNLMAQFLTSPSGSDVLSKDGVGRGLAIVQGIRNVPWTDATRSAGGAEGKFTDIQASIENYLNKCYILEANGSGREAEAYTTFHYKGDTSSIGAIWDRVYTDYIEMVDVKIDLADAKAEPHKQLCSSAHENIKTLLTGTDFKEALLDDAITHLTKQLAAVSLPGAGVSTTGGTDPLDLTKLELRSDAQAIFDELFGGGAYDSDLPKILFLEKMNQAALSAYGMDPRNHVSQPEGRLASAWNDAKRQNDLSMAAQGDWFTKNAAPMTRIIEGMVFAFIPIFLVMMFISQKGMKAFIGAAGIIMWLQTWPVAYVIINYFTTHTVIAQLAPLLDGDNLGMIDMYGVWEQAITSYSVSQSMLGMTPVLTGMLLSGSMMMLTKMAGNMSAAENFDEKRVHRDQESTEAMNSIKSDRAVYLDNNNGVSWDKNTVGDTTTTIGNQQQTVIAAQEARVDALQDTQNVQYTQSLQRAHAAKSATAVAELAAHSNSAQQVVTQTAEHALNEMSREELSKLSQEGMSAELSQSIQSVIDGGPSGSIKMSASDTKAVLEALSNSEGFQEKLGDALQESEVFQVNENASTSDLSEDTKTSANTQAYTDARSELKTAQKMLTKQKATSSSLDQKQEVSDGLFAKHFADLIDQAESQYKNFSGSDKEKQGQLQEWIQDQGYQEQFAADLSAQIIGKGYENKLMGTGSEAYQGANRDGLALLHTMRNLHAMDTQALALDLYSSNGFALGTTNDVNSEDAKKLREKSDAELGDNIGKGFDRTTGDVITKTKDARDLNTNNEFEKPKDVKTREEIEAAAESRTASTEAEISKAEQIISGFKEAVMQRRASHEEKGDDVSTQEHIFGAISGFGGRAADAEMTDIASLKAIADLDANKLADLAAHGMEVGLVSGDVPKGTESYFQSQAEERSKEEATESLLVGLVSGLGKSYEWNEGSRMQNIAILEELLPLLGEKVAQGFDTELSGAGDNIADQQAVISKYQAELSKLGIGSSQEWLEGVVSRITGAEINELDNLEKLGNYMSGIDNEKVGQFTENLKQAVSSYSTSNAAMTANAEVRATEEYQGFIEQNGSSVTNQTLALAEAMLEFSTSNGEFSEMSRVISDIEDEIVGDKGQNPLLSTVNGPMEGMRGVMDAEKLKSLMEGHLGEGKFEQYYDQLPEQVRGQFEEQYNELLEKVKEKHEAGRL